MIHNGKESKGRKQFKKIFDLNDPKIGFFYLNPEGPYMVSLQFLSKYWEITESSVKQYYKAVNLKKTSKKTLTLEEKILFKQKLESNGLKWDKTWTLKCINEENPFISLNQNIFDYGYSYDFDFNNCSIDSKSFNNSGY